MAIPALTFASSGSADPSAILDDPLLVAAAGLGLLGSQIGYPVWAIAVGRRLSHSAA